MSCLGSIFYWHSCLDKPSSQDVHFVNRENSKLSMEERDSEAKSNAITFAKLMQSLKGKISPILQRKVRFNLQDLCLMFSKEEMRKHEGSKTMLETMSELPTMSSKDIMWVNHLLR